MVSLGRPYHFQFFKGCLLHIVLGPCLNTLTHLFFRTPFNDGWGDCSNIIAYLELALNLSYWFFLIDHDKERMSEKCTALCSRCMINTNLKWIWGACKNAYTWSQTLLHQHSIEFFTWENYHWSSTKNGKGLFFSKRIDHSFSFPKQWN